MRQIPRNLLLSTDHNSLEAILANGYKVILCTEDEVSPAVLMHPNTVKASILLPPFPVISLESEGRVPEALGVYQNYLSSNEVVVSLLGIIAISAYRGNPLCLFIGTEARDLQVVNQLPVLLSNIYGIVFYHNSCGGIDADKVCQVESIMYLRGEITGMELLLFWPGGPFPPEVLPELFMALPLPGITAETHSDIVNQRYQQLAIDVQTGGTTNMHGQSLYMPFMAGSPNAAAGGKVQ